MPSDTRLPMGFEQLRAVGISDAQIACLVGLRQRYEAHEVSELTTTAKYLAFVKYLVDSGRLSDGAGEGS